MGSPRDSVQESEDTCVRSRGALATKPKGGEWYDPEADTLPLKRRLWRRSCVTTMRLRGWSLKTLVLAMGSLLILSHVALSSRYPRLVPLAWTPSDTPLPTDLPSLSPLSNSSPTNLTLRLITPADDPGPNLCKTILSTAANGYPAPVVVNFGQDFEKTSGRQGYGKSHIGKITGVLDMLDALMSDSAPKDERLTDDDLVVVLDAYDVWLQLPPAALIQRFHDQNAMADARLRASWTQGVNETTPQDEHVPPQSIIMSAQKKCWPPRGYGNPVRCDAMPPSPVRPDLYGPWTDSWGAHENRPRHVNSGSMMGKAGAMRRMFTQAQALVDAGRVSLGSDQGVFAEVMGEQEAWRARMRKLNARIANGRVSMPEADAEMEQLQRERHAFEFGIGLDYDQDLFMPTVFAEPDGEFMILGNTDEIEAGSLAHGIDPVRVQGLPDDLLGLAPPLMHTGIESFTVYEANLGWNAVPLYVDYWHANVPVAIHHNAHKHGMKPKRLHELWRDTWFFPHLRQIALKSAEAPKKSRQLASVRGRDGDLVYWTAPSYVDRPLARIFESSRLQRYGLEEAGWDALCRSRGGGEWWEEVFQDGQGPLSRHGGRTDFS